MNLTKLLNTCALIAVFWVSGCATVPSDLVGRPGRSVALRELCEKYDVSWHWDSVTQVVSLTSDGQPVQALVGSEILLIGSKRILLSRPIIIQNSRIMVPEDFELNVFSSPPAVGKPSQRLVRRIKNVNHIVLDAGHGGKDPGAIGVKGIQEKDVVLDLARRIARYLKAKGIKITMTRDTDHFITLARRTEIASQSKADLFVSIHANANSASSAEGVEVFTLKPLSDLERREEQRGKNQRLLFQGLNMKDRDEVLEEVVADILYHYKQGRSPALAANLSASLSQAGKAPNRGHKTSRFFVLRNTLSPAVLVEVGFLTNPHEGRKLSTPGYRDKLARVIVDELMDYVYE